MFSTLRNASVVSIILAIVNAVAAVLVYMVISPDLDPITMTAITAFVGSTSIILLIVGFALRNIHLDIEETIISINSQTVELRKRIDALEKKN